LSDKLEGGGKRAQRKKEGGGRGGERPHAAEENAGEGSAPRPHIVPEKRKKRLYNAKRKRDVPPAKRGRG